MMLFGFYEFGVFIRHLGILTQQLDAKHGECEGQNGGPGSLTKWFQKIWVVNLK